MDASMVCLGTNWKTWAAELCAPRFKCVFFAALSRRVNKSRVSVDKKIVREMATRFMELFGHA